MKYRCPQCGSSEADRSAYAKGDTSIPLNLSHCPHCGSLKCCMCDMGDDVGCINCEGED